MTTFRILAAGLLALTGSLSSVFADPASAGPRRDVVRHNDDGTLSMRVAHGDLDLATSTGKATLDSRIHHALRMVCPQDAAIHVGSCRKVARASVETQVLAAVARDTGEQTASLALGR